MKICLSVGQRPTNEYDKIYDPSGVVEPKSLWSIEEEDNECEYIYAHVLDYIPIQRIDEFLSYIKSKLRHGGTLVLGGTNLNELTRLYFMGDLGIEAYNQVIFSEVNKKGFYTPSIIKGKLKELGLIIENITLSDLEFDIEVRRD